MGPVTVSSTRIAIIPLSLSAQLLHGSSFLSEPIINRPVQKLPHLKMKKQRVGRGHVSSKVKCLIHGRVRITFEVS